MEREMKDSGVEWIGEIPANWQVRKMNDVAKIITDFVASGSFGDIAKNVKYLDNPDYAMLVRTADVSNKGITVKPVYVDKHSYNFLRNSNLFGGEILLPNVGAIGDVYIVPTLYKHMTLAPNSVIVRTKYCDKYFYYYFCSDAGKTQVNNITSKTAMPKFNKTDFRQIKVLLPEIKEQQRIASFLDTKCAEIDKAIDATKSSIEEYKKLRLAIITEAVTKGLDPNVEMKDSGVEWIGKIPSKWNVKKLRFLGFCQNGISKGAEFFGDEGFPFVSYSDVYKNIHLPIPLGTINSSKEEQKLYSVKKGDIFFTRTSETIEEIGFSSVCLETIPEATFAGFLIRVRPTTGELNERFSSYYFRSDIHRLYFIKEMNLVTRASLGQTLLKNLPVLIPPINEQVYIADFLDTKCAEIDSLIKSKEKLIEELTAYRKSLIYEYVTGKKEV